MKKHFFIFFFTIFNIQALSIVWAAKDTSQSLTKKEKADIERQIAEIEEIMTEESLEKEMKQAIKAAKKFDDPQLLHEITHPRETALEKRIKINKTPLVKTGEPAPKWSLQETDNNFTFEFTNNPTNPHVGILVQDCAEPLMYLSRFAADSICLGNYFDDLIDALAKAIASKHDVVRYNLKILRTTQTPKVADFALTNLDEFLQKILTQNDFMQRMAISFFQSRIPTLLISLVEKNIENPPFILHKAPQKDSDQRQNDAEANAITISFRKYGPVRVLLNPLLIALRKPLEEKMNFFISGYKSNKQESVARIASTLGANIFKESIAEVASIIHEYMWGELGNIASSTSSSFLQATLEFSKQMGYSSTIDETFLFTITTEFIYDMWFFYRTLNNVIKKNLIGIIKKESEALERAIVEFQEQRKTDCKSEGNQSAEFHAAIYKIVVDNLGPLQPELLQELRWGRQSFQNKITFALLVPALWKLCSIVWNIGKTAFNQPTEQPVAQ